MRFAGGFQRKVGARIRSRLSPPASHPVALAEFYARA